MGNINAVDVIVGLNKEIAELKAKVENYQMTASPAQHLKELYEQLKAERDRLRGVLTDAKKELEYARYASGTTAYSAIIEQCEQALKQKGAKE